MADLVQMEAVERGVATDDVEKGRQKVLSNRARGGVEIEPTRSHSIETTIRLGQVEVGVVQQRTAEAIDQDRAGAQILKQFRVTTGRQREHVDPRMDTQAAPMGGFEKLPQDIGPRLLYLGRSLDEIGSRVKDSAAAIDLHEEVGCTQLARTIQEWVDARRVIEHAVAALREDPEATRRSRLGRPFDCCFGTGLDRRSGVRIWRQLFSFGEIVRRTG